MHYLDVCTGQLVSSFRTKRGPNDVMTQNTANAIIFTGGSKGKSTLKYIKFCKKKTLCMFFF